jgi:ATP-dependent DNA helicase
MKMDVETNLPPKKEYVLYCPLSVRQREAYDKVLDGGLRSWLIRGGTSGEVAIKEEDENKDQDQSEKGNQIEQDGDTNCTRSSRRLATMGQKSYVVDGDDDEYFEMVERGEVDERGVIILKSKEEEANEQARMATEHQFRTKG